MDELADFYFSQDGLVLIPVEHLSATGVSAEYRTLFLQRTCLGRAWLDLFEAAFRTYWQRLQALHQHAPAHWFPPRIQHVCIVTDPSQVRPYFQPFQQSAWLLYASDFDPLQSNLEFACFQFFQVERMGQLAQVVAATGANLSYWLLRSEEEITAYKTACGQNQRPDTHGQRALAKHLHWLRHLYHESIRVPSAAEIQRQQLQLLPGTGLYLPRSRLADMERLVHSCSRAAHETVTGFFKNQTHVSANQQKLQALDALCDWLGRAEPRLLLSGQGGELVWDYTRPSAVDRLRSLLKEVSAKIIDSLKADCAVIGQRSQQFVSALRSIDSLPQPQAHYADQNGLCYMHIQRRELTYNLHEEGMQRLRETAPPFERLMLGARAIHEWGHLFVDSGGVPIADHLRQQHADAQQVCAELFAEIIARAPQMVQKNAANSLNGLRQADENNGQALTRLSLARMEDFQANLMAQRFLPQAEMETYVRNNHRSHVHDYPRAAYFQRLARYAYEYQYLRFSAMHQPEAFFLKTTWFAEQYMNSGVLSWELAQALFQCIGDICDCYQVDQARFHSA